MKFFSSCHLFWFLRNISLWWRKFKFSFKDSHRENRRFTQFSTGIYCNRSLAASDLFHRFTQWIKFHTYHWHILKSPCVWKRWFSKWTENEQLLLSASSRQNMSWFLSEHRKTTILRGFILKPNKIA